MENILNIHQYICTPPEISYTSYQNFLQDVDEEELFETMDEIINQKYPDCIEYDIEDETPLPINKKLKVIHIDGDNYVDTTNKFNNQKVVNTLYDRDDVWKSEDRKIQLKIEAIFYKMKQNC